MSLPPSPAPLPSEERSHSQIPPGSSRSSVKSVPQSPQPSPPSSPNNNASKSTESILFNPLKTFEGHDGLVLCVSFLPGGKEIVSTGADGTIRFWDLESGEQVGEPLKGHEEDGYRVALSPDGTKLASGGQDKRVLVWDLETKELDPHVGPFKGHTGGVTSLDFSPDGLYLASGGYDNRVIVWNLTTGEAEVDSIQCDGTVYSLKFSREGSQLATGSGDNHVRVWDWRSGTVLVGPMEGHTGFIYGVFWLHDDEELVTGSADNTIRRWNALTGEALGDPLDAHGDSIFFLAMSNDASLLASTSTDHTLKLWDTTTYEQRGNSFVHKSIVYRTAISPDNKFVCSTSEGLIHLWEVPPEPDRNASFLDLPAVTLPGDEIGESSRQGAQNHSFAIDDFLDFPATSRPSGAYAHGKGGAGVPNAPKKRFIERFRLPRRRRPRSDTGIELQERSVGRSERGKLKVLKMATAKAKKFIVVMGRPPQAQSNAARDAEDQDSEGEEDGEEEDVESDSDSDPESVHGCCWRCCHWVCYEMVTCHI
ncbi:hypothetical protein HYDPIDRAFT_111711 [Hydnomerulius pinastri MD-312]|uniref:WD40 repeat-like protein n=1 Tax=Hydnomerulius pinastri MD-312 TaxID=994086 RepID=A0A0C9W0T1_9AGAM|nr:hypothetical protein HYDPIDRAFT_111711 [Hydnomerulius pinastri MD-312]